MIKKLLIFLIVLSITIPFADAVPLSDKTGLKFTFPVKTDGHTFVVEATGNLDVTNLDFDKDKKSITLFVLSSLENNSLEISLSQAGRAMTGCRDQDLGYHVDMPRMCSIDNLNNIKLWLRGPLGIW